MGHSSRSHRLKFALEATELADLGIDLCNPSLEELLRMPARARTAFPDREKLPDVTQLQSEGLGTPDEMKPLDCGLAKLTIARASPGRFWEKTLFLVVTDRVGRDTRSLCQLRHL